MTKSGVQMPVPWWSQDGIDLACVLDSDGCLRGLNETAAVRMGSQHQPLLGTALIEHVHPEDVEQASALFRQVLFRQVLFRQVLFRQVLFGHPVHPHVVRLRDCRRDTIAGNWMFPADALTAGGLTAGGLIGVGQFMHQNHSTADVASTRHLKHLANEPRSDFAGCDLSGGELKRFSARASHDLSGPIRAIDGFESQSLTMRESSLLDRENHVTCWVPEGDKVRPCGARKGVGCRRPLASMQDRSPS